MNRRDAVTGLVRTVLATALLPGSPATLLGQPPGRTRRVVNIMNFMRSVEPREPMDLMKPVREQIALITRHEFPATWLLQYDALVNGPFVPHLREHLPGNHEVGLWLEMNRFLCEAAGVAWRGRPGWDWDYAVPVAYTIGYTQAERRKLADAAMAGFRRTFGETPRTVACWNLDAYTLAHLADEYGVDAFANCRDQISTDGFTIWGAPYSGGYFPSRRNALCPALSRPNQIPTPMFRLLGQDPVYAYDLHGVWSKPGRGPWSTLSTMEPGWKSGQSETFIRRFLDLTANAPALAMSYVQLGQENSFAWTSELERAYVFQMEQLAKHRAAGTLTVETMGSTGRWFKEAYRSTPAQAQVALEDPFDHGGDGLPAQRTVWYHSRFYRANLHFLGATVAIRDLHVYSDRFAERYLETPVERHGIELRAPAVLDGHHWSSPAPENESADRSGLVQARGWLRMRLPSGEVAPLEAAGKPTVTERGSALDVVVPLAGGGRLRVGFEERELVFVLDGAPRGARPVLALEWAAGRSALTGVTASELAYRFEGFAYGVKVSGGRAERYAAGAAEGVTITGTGSRVRLGLAQVA